MFVENNIGRGNRGPMNVSTLIAEQKRKERGRQMKKRNVESENPISKGEKGRRVREPTSLGRRQRKDKAWGNSVWKENIKTGRKFIAQAEREAKGKKTKRRDE